MKTIVILSGVPYDSMKQRPQHFASYFARKGYEVLYIFLHDFDKIDSELISNINSRERLLKLFSKNMDNIYYLKDKINKEILKISSLTLLINQIVKVYGGEKLLFISSFPEWIKHLESIPESSILIYDCLDEWGEFIDDVDMGYNEELIYNERKMASVADLVITSAKRLYINMSYFNDNIYYLPNGVRNDDYKHKEEKSLMPLDLQHIKQPIIFFMGGVADWVDIDLIRFAAESRSQYSFVFVGTQMVKLPKLPNIHFLGLKNYKDLSEYLTQAKVAVVPFKVNNLTAAVTPLKFYEYLSSGTPVVTTIMPDIIGLKGAKIALNKHDFVKHLDFYINMDSEDYEIESCNAKNTANFFEWEYLLKPLDSIIETENIDFYLKETFINNIIKEYKQYQGNNLITNELLNAYNSLGDYESSIKLIEKNVYMEQIDYEKLALAYIKINSYEKAIYYLKLYIEKNENILFIQYVNNLMADKNYKVFLEIYLLKLSGNIYEALYLTEELARKHGMKSEILGLLAGLYLEIGEYDISSDLLIRALGNSEPHKIEKIADVYLISFFIRYLIKIEKYGLAEDVALSLIPISKEWESEAIKLLSEIYISRHMC